MTATLLAQAAQLLSHGQPLAMATVLRVEGSVPGKQGAKMLVLEDGSTKGTIGGAGLEEIVKAHAREVLSTHTSRSERFDLSRWKEGGLDSLCGGSVTVVIEYLRPPPRLLMIGGGHVARAVADQCDLLGLGYGVIDDRPEFASAERFPKAQVLMTSEPAAALRTLSARELRGFSDALLLGYSYHVDVAALDVLLERFPGIIGVIGSRTKWTAMCKILRANGHPPERLEGVHCPVGLSIGANSVPEIAISIVSQIIASDRLGPTAALLAASAGAWEQDRRQSRAAVRGASGGTAEGTASNVIPWTDLAPHLVQEDP